MYVIFTGNSNKTPLQVMTSQTAVVASAHPLLASAYPLLGAHWVWSQEERCMMMMIILWNGTPCSLGESGRATKSRFGPQWTNFFRTRLSRVGRLKFIDAKLETLTLSCRVMWTWFESVNLYRCQIMILASTTKAYTTQSGLGPLSEPLDPLICIDLGPGHWQ
jgi:hypothetical protein